LPELPDVELLRRYVEATSLHKTIAEATIDAPRMLHDTTAAQVRSRLLNKAFEAAGRHGKHLLIEIDEGGWLMLHFGMTGKLDYARDDAELPNHTRLVIRFENGYRLAGTWQRRLGEIGIADDPESFVAARGLGPDALSVGLDSFKQRLGGRRGAIKPALMDQGLIAGLGNVYTDEILFHAGLDPGRQVPELSPAELGELHRAMLHVLRLAIERKADPARVPDSWLLPHRRPDAHCPRCGTRIDRVKTSGRAGYRCPACQK
jgi:formamidopyrimidine-DNA glycosylase